MINKFLIEGLDRLGKSSLIDGIRNALGYFEVIHYQKPQKLSCYNGDPLIYQENGFRTMFSLLRSSAPIICDRAHLGEYVYAPMYRKYSGDYVFNLEVEYGFAAISSVRLILLTEDFSVSNHFVDDGESFDISKRAQEQELFIEAFNKSNIKDKRIISVTDRTTGKFRSKEQILEDALA
jgi:thymidylate kinase